MYHVHDCRIDRSQQGDWCEDPCSLCGSVFFQGDKCQRQQQPRQETLDMIERIKTVNDSLAVCGPELADIGRYYDL